MNTLIVGNGFDLAHRLPTAYINFLDAISNNAEFHEYIKNINNKKLYPKVKNGQIFGYIQSQSKKKGWIDFENELTEIVDSFCKFKKELTKVTDRSSNSVKYVLETENITHLSPFLHKFLFKKRLTKTWTSEELSQLKQELHSQIFNFINLFNQYIKWITKDKLSIVDPIDLFSKMDVDYFLSFNYTTTFLKLYNINDKIPRKNISFVHGKIDEKTDNGIVMGIGSDFYDESKHDDFVEFFKFFQRYKYSTDTNYLDWIEDYKISKFKEGSKHTIYIYGHSLDPTDRDILLPFFDLGNINIIIYYLDERSKSNLEKNLLKLLGKKRFQKYLIGNPSKVKFEKVPKK